jgi:integrase/predicted RNase H-like HicB family nuclease
MENRTVQEGLKVYKDKVSILKKGYAQEISRIDLISRSSLGQKVIREVSSVDIASYRDLRLGTVNTNTGRQLSPSTVRLELALLSNFFKLSQQEWGWADDNPVNNVRKPKPPPGRDRRLSPREDRLILRYATAHKNVELYVIIVLALTTAMRQGEILGLVWENVNLKKGIAHLPDTKNGTVRDVPLSQRARTVFQRLDNKSTGRIFGYTADGLKSTWRFMLERLGINNLHFHDLRHEAVSRLFELGTLDVMEVAAISGHKSMSMLKRYTHLSVLKLLPKLEGPKNKAFQVLRNNLVPYPAKFREVDGTFHIKILDFEDLEFEADSREAVLLSAREKLKTTIYDLLSYNRPIPSPDQYEDHVAESDLVMVDPLPELA